MWVPKVSVARRCAAKLLTAHRGGGIDLSFGEEVACVDAISFPYLSRKLCRMMGHLWIRDGRLSLSWEEHQDSPPLREKPGMDAGLRNVLESVG